MAKVKESLLSSIIPIGIRVTTENWVWIAYIDEESGIVDEHCCGKDIELMPKLGFPYPVTLVTFEDKPNRQYMFNYTNV